MNSCDFFVFVFCVSVNIKLICCQHCNASGAETRLGTIVYVGRIDCSTITHSNCILSSIIVVRIQQVATTKMFINQAMAWQTYWHRVEFSWLTTPFWLALIGALLVALDFTIELFSSRRYVV
jgi:hypothetical protein